MRRLRGLEDGVSLEKKEKKKQPGLLDLDMIPVFSEAFFRG